MKEGTPDLTIRARPRAVRRFSRKALIAGSVALGALMFCALAVALQTPDYEDDKSGELYNVTNFITSPISQWQTG